MPPYFNLSQDLSTNGTPCCFTPVDEGPTDDYQRDDYQLYFNPEARTLRIALPDEFSVKAVVPGKVSLRLSDAGLPSIILETDFFWSAAQSDAAIWFRKWAITGRVPWRIIYENVNATPGLFPEGVSENYELVPPPGDPPLPGHQIDVEAGAELGTALRLEPIRDTNPYGVQLRVEYSDDHSMHPRELLSLLFWREACDSLLYPSATQQYESALLQKMMACRESGEAGDYHADQDWLGLRPPLRTFKRTAWEAILTHTLHHENWQREGSLTGVLKNPLIGGSYAGASKCNIFAGEMAFRSGFRTFVVRSGGAGPLQYISRGTLLVECTDPNEDGEGLFTSNRRHPPTVSWRSQEYNLNLPYGKKRYVTSDTIDVDQINAEIAEEGMMIIYARKGYCVRKAAALSSLPLHAYPTVGADGKEHCSGSNPSATSPDTDDYEHRVFHVVVLAELASTGSDFNWSATRVFDQHCRMTTSPRETPRFCTAPYCGFSGLPGGSGSLGRAFTEMIPGGDPTELWGQIDLNCLTRR